jgi:hypothetical protein
VTVPHRGIIVICVAMLVAGFAGTYWNAMFAVIVLLMTYVFTPWSWLRF